MKTLGKLALAAIALTAMALPASAAPPPNLVVHCWVFGETVVGPYGVSNVWYLVTDKNTHKQRYVSDANVDIDQSLYPNC
ncbi:hypothetical protein E1263_38960 [Kribbella antibiotica]|uniref:Uncharacterized protein n=1 Tax=Kribbella antibiotica TaxID=190195 RepID=A0A4R4YK40_9ACTN|nr:hypothetical protein [Kribbella antibiotica]TDD45315.1 hypothetical protein E1263_38960 [Kribbella antibiotica]